ncbi:MAG: hypothetical protein ABI457_07705 [Hyphomicrobium sp.]
MEVTESVKNLFRGFHQDMFEHAQTAEEIAEESLGFLGPEDAPLVIAFLDELLSGAHSDQEVQKIWHEMPTDIYFDDPRGTIKVLGLVRDLLKTHPHFKSQK